VFANYCLTVNSHLPYAKDADPESSDFRDVLSGVKAEAADLGTEFKTVGKSCNHDQQESDNIINLHRRHPFIGSVTILAKSIFVSRYLNEALPKNIDGATGCRMLPNRTVILRESGTVDKVTLSTGTRFVHGRRQAILAATLACWSLNVTNTFPSPLPSNLGSEISFWSTATTYMGAGP